MRRGTCRQLATMRAGAIAAIRQQTEEHLALTGMTREKVLATVIRILDATAMRVGNKGSASENHTFGLTTLRNQHVEMAGATLRFHFTGKSGVRHELEITDRRVARVVRQCHDLPGQKLFEYVDESGELRGRDFVLRRRAARPAIGDFFGLAAVMTVRPANIPENVGVGGSAERAAEQQQGG